MRLIYFHVALVILLIRNFCVCQFHQDDYDIEQDRFEIVEYNKTASTNLSMKVFKYNDTLKMKAINFTIYFKPGVRKNILIALRLFKYVQKSYRLFPIPNMTLDLCDEYNQVGDRNPFGIQSAISSSNFKGCPVSKGFYYINSWILEQDKFPPHLPGGNYKISINVQVDDDIFVFNIDWFGSIISKKKKRRH